MLVNKTGETSNNLRKLFILFLAFTFLIAAGSLLLRHSIFKKLDTLAEQLRGHAQNQEISNILLDLNGAESDFQQAILYGESQKLEDYKTKLTRTFNQIEVILKKYDLDSTRMLSANKAQLGKAFDDKLMISNEIFSLKHNFDSLLRITNIQSIGGQPSKDVIEKYKFNTTIKRSTGKADTSVRVIKPEQKKKGLFKRLQDAIENKQENAQSVKVVTVNREKQIRDSVNRSVLRKQSHSQGDILRKLNEENGRLAKSNQQLISANLSLVIQLHQLVQELKDIHLNDWEKARTEMLNQYQSATNDMNSFTGVAVLMILIFIILLIIYIRKAGKSEDNYIRENERAVALAEQKSEMLAIMSHEIRNPLTTITGLIYLLNRSPLNDDQKKKLNSINLSSSMLMDTINDILDVSKIDHQKETALKIVSFQPCVEIKETVAAMTFIAERKQISLSAEFTGEEEAMVNGDPFRLKQIMINLLNNAVKYTDQGGVVVKVNLNTVDGNTILLNVSIIDTGIGIPKDQQGKLFTRYYQANRSAGKPGTGLGLYICKQLIELQNGHISVESDAGKGCHFKFDIPYQKPE
ncbi:HAMP domain-containing sensor histidine kinase [Pedobacter gandavensis]|uniref:sensor histidine kinase n=1 Tax=Pedobacter gandavensis TaxID=2679963 RepID=UPI002930AA1A|nr:HAMP domain-containing sensor histidine kinase [Pedobacter gandavensis]